MAEFDREAIDTRIAKYKQAFNDAAGSTKWEDVCMDFAVTGLDDIEACLAEIDRLKDESQSMKEEMDWLREIVDKLAAGLVTIRSTCHDSWNFSQSCEKAWSIADKTLRQTCAMEEEKE